MTAYLFITLKILDKAQFLVYAEAARGIAPKYGGKYLSTGRPLDVLEGDGVTLPIVLTEWPSADHIRQFWTSEEYQEAIKLRVGAVDVQATIFEGNEAQKVEAAEKRAQEKL